LLIHQLIGSDEKFRGHLLTLEGVLIFSTVLLAEFIPPFTCLNDRILHSSRTKTLSGTTLHICLSILLSPPLILKESGCTSIIFRSKIKALFHNRA